MSHKRMIVSVSPFLVFRVTPFDKISEALREVTVWNTLIKFIVVCIRVIQYITYCSDSPAYPFPCPLIAGILTFMSWKNFMLSLVEHDFYNLRPRTSGTFSCLSCRAIMVDFTKIDQSSTICSRTSFLLSYTLTVLEETNCNNIYCTSH